MSVVREAIIDSLRCVGADRGLVYVTVPITTGLREFVLMKELSCSRDDLRSKYRSRWLSEVVEPNEADAEAYARMTQLYHPDKLVLNPAHMRVDGWGQEHYTEMWNQVLVEFCDLLVVTPDWTFSSGAIGEVREMALLGREITDVVGRSISNSQLQEMATHSRGVLVSMGFDERFLEEHLPRLHLPGRRSNSMRRFTELDWDRSVDWLMRERRWQVQRAFDDDGRTRDDGPHLAQSRWKQRLEKYLDVARSRGIDSPEGGIALAQYVTVCVALMESVWRIYGSLPEPGHPRGVVRMGRFLRSADSETDTFPLIVAWLRREHSYTIAKYDFRDDDDHTRNAHRDEYWWRQLDWYYGLSCNEGLETPQGRQCLGKFVSTGLSFLTSRWRVFGPVGTPTRPSVETLFS